jgi:hypothetical protein
MSIAIQETVGQVGPVENPYGLDVMTRVFMGSRSQYAAWRATHLPGVADTEYPNMKIESLSPADTESGDIIKITVQYNGSSTGTEGSPTWKDPQTSSSLAPLSETRDITMTRRFGALTVTETFPVSPFGATSWRYDEIVDTAPGTVTIQWNTRRITYRYSRSYMVSSPEYSSQATTFLTGLPVDFQSGRAVLTGEFPVRTYNQATTFLGQTLPGIINNRVTPNLPTAADLIVRLADLNSEQRGVYFETAETWELAFPVDLNAT